MTQNVGTTSGEGQDPEPVLPAPGERRKLREAAHLTYEQVAATVGVTGTTVRSWELGRTEPRGRKRESYAAFLAGLSERAAARDHTAGGHPRPRPKSPARHAHHDPTPTAHPLQTTPSAQTSPPTAPPSRPQPARAQAAPPPHPAHTARAAQTPPPPQTAHPTHTAPSPHPAQTAHVTQAAESAQSAPALQAAPSTETTPVTPSSSPVPPTAPAYGAEATPGPAWARGAPAAPGTITPAVALGSPAIIGMSAPAWDPSTPAAPAAPETITPTVALGAPAITGMSTPATTPSLPEAPGSSDTPATLRDPSTPDPAAAPAAPAAPTAPAITGMSAPATAPGSSDSPAPAWDPAAPGPAGGPPELDAPASAEGGDAPGTATAGGLDTPPVAAVPEGPAPGADSGDPAEPPAPLTPADVFDALYDRAAPALLRQAYLLTGRRALAMESVERAFHLAWNRWPEIVADPDPVGWVRAAAYEYALSPWHQFRRGHRHPDKPPAEPADRILLDAMLHLSPMHRRTVLLYDGIGLDLPDTAAETEATTPTAGNRLLRAHAELAARIPELAVVPPEKQSAVLRHRLGALRPSVPLEPRPAEAVRGSGEHRTRLWGRAVLGLTAMIAVATSYTLTTAPTQYIPPLAPGASVSGVPPLSGPQHLTERSKVLHDKLRNDPEAGPARLAPKAG
ncbi:helix-turn-helix domain-containing protein [Streptomyces goshikiensis]|uniref:helix-turn-helix domain-containing protein n=1 Tax=Streptomyces goshikiensis TaxID=1942 RepID=UPI003695C18F